MDRVIKFRGKVIGNARAYKIDDWAYGDLAHVPELGVVISTPHDGSLEWSGVVDENTVGQFTGLYDKNGNKIYEGDNIILHQFLFDGGEYENQLIGQVIYDDNQACYCLTNIKNEQVQEYMGFKDDYTNFLKETVPIILFYGMHEESFEVIGNIHEVKE